MKNNTWVVLQREYTTRVKKKGFFIMTILGPILLVALMFAPALLMQMGDESKTYALVDETGLYSEAFAGAEDTFEAVADTAAAKAGMRDGQYAGALWIPAAGADSNRQRMVLFYQETDPSMSTIDEIESLAENELRMALMQKESDLDPALFEYINNAKVDVISQDMVTGERSYTEIKSIIAYVFGFLIYGFVFIYGSQIMSGVIEEKSNRIIEVMISSVKPFQLLMGKVLGLAFVGLTQLLLWGVLTLVLTMVIGMLGGGGSMEAAQMAAAQSSMPGMGTAMPMTEVQATMVEIQAIIESLHIKSLLLFFLAYFLGGYLLYASLFAAIGAAVEDQEDTNQFMWPVTIPLILGILVVATVLKSPDGPLAFWTSIIPFTSPIVMMARIPFGVPVWELVLSLGLLVLGFIGSTWVAARIYRVGILMYGKKGSYKELWKWIRYKE